MSTPSKKLLSSTLFLSMLLTSLQPVLVNTALAQTVDEHQTEEQISQEEVAEIVADLEPIAATEDADDAALSTMVLEDGTEVQVKGLIIKYKDTPTEAEADETLESVAITPEPEPYFGLFTDEDAPIEDELEIIHFEEECGQHDIEARIEILEQEENIEYVEPNVVVSLLSTEPNDSQFSDQWALPAIRVPEAWDIQTGSTDTVIALIDTGINRNHPDAPASILPGYDVLNDDAHPNDDHGHGTAMASIIAASTNNEVGIAGTCPRCSILPIKALDEHGGSTFDVIAEAVRFAADNGAHIINLSLGAPFDSKTMREAIEYAQNKEALVIAAGGNSSSETVMFPAGYQNVLGVGATDQNNAKASFSNTGPHIDVVAPGVNILSHASGGGFGEVHGSSPAAAHVAGVAGLIKSQKPSSNASFIATSIVETAEDLGAKGRDDQFGYGLVDARSSLFYEGLGGFEDDESHSQVDDILNWEQSVLIWAKHKVEEVIDNAPGSLKNYTFQHLPGEPIRSAAEAVEYGTSTLQFSVSQPVMLVVMELYAGALSDPLLTNDDFNLIFDFSTDDYYTHVLQDLGYSQEDAEPYGTYESLTKQLHVATGIFDEARNCFAYYLKSQSDDYNCGNIVLKDGTKLAPNLNVSPETHGLHVLLGALAQNKDQWDLWISKEEGSFYQVHNYYFDDPLQKVEILHEKSDEPPDVTVKEVVPVSNSFTPFLERLPFARSRLDFGYVTAGFDHNNLGYGETGPHLDGEFLSFLESKEVTKGTIACQQSYNCYTGHTGVDYGTRFEPLYAPSDGEVLKNFKWSETSGFGNVLTLQHKSVNDEHDFITNYAHINESTFTNSDLAVGSDVTINQFIGNSDGTGITGSSSDFVEHLHFEVRKIYQNTENNKFYYPVFDPYGWWQGTKDPTEENILNSTSVLKVGSSTKSEWVWGNGQAVTQVGVTDVNFVDLNNTESGRGIVFQNNSNDAWKGYPNNEAREHLWARTKYNPDHQWDVSGFWVSNLEDADSYTPQAFIPDVTIPNQTVSSEAQYKIYDKDPDQGTSVVHDVSINQNAMQGRWVSLGTYNFNVGANSAVRLVDEVSSSENHDNIIWADAVRWVKPQLKLFEDSIEIQNGGRLIFNAEEGESARTKTVIIENSGNDNFVAGTVEILGDDNNFRLVSEPNSSLSSGRDSSFKIEYSGAAHVHTPDRATLYIEYTNSANDLDEGRDEHVVVYTAELVGSTDSFPDIEDNAWYKMFVQYLSKKGVIQGNPDGEYKGANTTNRAEGIKLAFEAAGINVSSAILPSGALQDVNGDEWFAPYVAYAYSNNLNLMLPCHSGSGTCFRPAEPVTRYDIAKLVYAAVHKRPSQSCTSTSTQIFSDVPLTADYCQAVHWLNDTEVGYHFYDPHVVYFFFSEDFSYNESSIARGYEPVSINGETHRFFGIQKDQQGNEVDDVFINRAEISKVIALTDVLISNEPIVMSPRQEEQVTILTNQEYVILGKDFEQRLDTTNQNPPSPISLPGGNTQTVQGSYTFDLPTQDSDSDRLFYYYVADGGTFEEIDSNYFAKARWIAPEVTSTTSFTVHITAGDGRGLIRRSSVQFTVEPGGHTGDDICTEVAASSIELLSNNPENLEPAALTETTFFLDGEDDPSKPALEVEEVQVEELSIDTLASDVQDISFYDDVTEETVEWSPDLSQAQPASVEVDGVNVQGWSNVTSLNGNNAFPGGLWKRYDNNATDGNVTWDRVTCKGFSNTTSFWSSGIGNPRPDCNRHANNQDSWLVYGPFDLSDATNADFTFRHYTDTVEDDDRFYWMASGNATSWSTNSYTTRSGQWRRVTKNLNSYLGDSSVWIAFRFRADQSRNGEGAYIDDLVLRKFTEDFPNLSSFNYTGPSQSSLPPGELLTASFGVKNYGQSASNGGVLKVYLKQGSPVFSDSYKIDEESLGSFSSFQDRSYSLRYNLPHSLSPGQYSLYWHIDANNNVEETSESDNKFVDYITITDKPDPSIRSVRVTSSALKPGETLRSVIQVENQGGAVMPAHTLYSYFSKDHVSYNSSDRFGQAISIAEADPGTSKTYAQNVTIAPGTPPGTYYVSYELQPWFAEKTTSNNRRAYQITVLSDAEIVVHEAEVNQQVFLSGQQLRVSADIKNQGTTATTPFTVSYYLANNAVSFTSDQRIGATQIGALSVNGVQPVSFDYTIPNDIEAGQYEVCIYADSENTNIEEFDGHHNRHCTSVAIEHPQRPDLRTLCIETSAHTAQRGDSITFSTKVINTGEVDAPSNPLQFLVAHNSDQRTDASVVATRTLQSLSSGNHQRVDVDYSIPTNADYGTYTVFAVANPNEAFRESAHDNNVALATFTINDPTPPQDPQPTPDPDPQDPPSDDQPEGNEDEEPSLPSSLTVHLPFNEGQGSVTTERVSQASLTLANTQWSTSTPSSQGHSLSFNGSNSYTTVTNNTIHESKEASLCGWFNSTNKGVYQGLFGFSAENPDSKGGNQGFFFRIDTANNLEFIVNARDDVLEVPITSLLNGDWHYLCGIYDGSKLSIYLNGELQKSIPYTAPINISSHSELEVGRYRWVNLNLSYYFTGLLDDIQLHDKALSAQEIREVYDNKGLEDASQNPTPPQDPQPTPDPDPQDPPSDDQPEGNEDEEPSLPSSLTVHLPFNEGQGSVTTERVSQASLTLANTQWSTSTPSSQGHSLSFNGSNSYTTVTNNTIHESKEASLCGWFNSTNKGVYQGLFGFSAENPDSKGGNQGFFFRIDTANNLEFIVNARDDVLEVPITSLLNGDWHYLCGIYDGSKLSIYLNGELQKSIPYTAPINISSHSELEVGRYRWVNLNLSYYFTGLLDDIQLHDKALSAQEIREVYDNKGLEDASQNPTPPQDPQPTPDPDPQDPPSDDQPEGNEDEEPSLPSSLTVHLPFNEGQGSVTTERVSQASLTLANTQWSTSTPSSQGHSLSFNGSNSYTTVTNNTIHESKEASLCGWFNSTNKGVYQGLFGFSAENPDSKGGNQGFFFRIDTANNLEFIVNARDDVLEVPITSLLNGDWHYLCGIYDGSKLSIYLNGELQKSIPYTAPINISSHSELEVGRYRWVNLNLSYYFTGLLDDIQLHDKALSAQEIREVYEEFITP